MALTQITAATAITLAGWQGNNEDWAIKEYHFGPFGGTAGANLLLAAGSIVPLMTTQEVLGVDLIGIYLSCNVVAAASSTIQFWKAPIGTTLSGGTALTAAEEMNGVVTAFTLWSPALVAAAAVNIPPGQRIGFTTAAFGVAMLGLSLSLIFRKTATITTAAGGRMWAKTQVP